MRTTARSPLALIVLVAAGLAGCATPGTGLVQTGPDAYRLSRIDSTGQYPDSAALRAAVEAEAEAFAHQQGRVLVPVATREETMRVG
ncbi:MAG: hypothetical protein JSR54_12450, partial [Proteobacteria bacterium]|nr:hypothetical protein [Pseudomonadota bacterium]